MPSGPDDAGPLTTASLARSGTDIGDIIESNWSPPKNSWLTTALVRCRVIAD